MFKVKLNHPLAQVPTRQSDGSAGYDLYSVEEVVVAPRQKAIIDTGISITLPDDSYGRVAPRSGLAAKHNIDVGAGVIDRDFRGILKVILFNHSDNEFKVNVGDRVAQLIIEKIMTPEVTLVEDLDETVRGDGGFGSTGMN
jgi:deoxyuridine 5'-triphosphate nucleotidohydrolase